MVGILVVIFMSPVEVFGTKIRMESSDQYHSDKGDLQLAARDRNKTNCDHELERLSDHSQFTPITNLDLWL